MKIIYRHFEIVSLLDVRGFNKFSFRKEGFEESDYVFPDFYRCDLEA